MSTVPLDKKLSGLKVVIASHIYATGPALELEEYLMGKTKSLLFIGHPFSYRARKDSFYRVYKGGEMASEGKSWGDNLPSVLFYLRDVVLTFWWVVKKAGKVDLFVGSDNFLAFLGILLKRIGKVEKVVLYTIDYMPKRFGNPVLNSLYHFFDRRCMKECEVVWNVSGKISKAREERGMKGPGYAQQITVPLGIWYERIPDLPFSKKSRYKVMFMGHVLAKQGLQVVIKALPALVKKLPKVELVVIGSGDFLPELKKLAKRLKLSSRIKFLGYIESHKEVENELVKGVLSVATYEPDPGSFTRWADPGKIKNYLACGLPVVLTDVPPIASDLVRNKCGVIVEYNAYSVASEMMHVLSNDKMLKEYCENARKYAKSFDWNEVFRNALKETI